MDTRQLQPSDQRDILLIEQSVELRMDMIHKLSSLGYQVRAAASYEQAIHALEKHHVSLVLTSGGLTSNDHLALARRLRRFDISRQPRLLDVTEAFADFSQIEDGDAWQELSVDHGPNLAVFATQAPAAELPIRLQ